MTYYIKHNSFYQVERKRARNRVAATKCRLRKLERISVLDNEASKLRVENELLSKTTENLKQKVCNNDDSCCSL